MFFYHLKFELYLPSPETPLKDYQGLKKEPSQKILEELYYVPKNIFAPLPVHSKPNKLPLRETCRNSSKIKAKSREFPLAKVRKPVATDQVPAIPPTPAPEKENPKSGRNSLGWQVKGRGKTIVPSSTAVELETSTTPDKTQDFRFGPISIEWFAQESLKMSEKVENITLTSNEDVEDQVNFSNSRPPATTSSTASTTVESNGQTVKKSGYSITRPTAQYVPLEPNRTNLGFGILHLYRDPKEISVLPTTQATTEVENDSLDQINPPLEDIEELLEQKIDDPNLGINERTILAVLAVPISFSASDFLGFVAPVRKFVSHFRMIKDPGPNKYLVLMKFRNSRSAMEFYNNYNGRAFSSMEPEICHVVYIKSIEFKSTSKPAHEFSFLHDPFLLEMQQSSSTSIPHELPTCPVCLERMDSNATGLLTIQCQHTFHCKCLSKWGDSSCPVCRYSQKRDMLDNSLQQNECGVCGATESLWMCILCGNVGCGRYQGAHAYYHYKETPTHLYAIELETQRVWDYAGDGYVHRLIQNKSDGKLVELPSPNTPSQIQTTQNTVSQDKVDQIELEYSHLVITQLSSQRTYYEEKLASVTLQISSLNDQFQKLIEEVSSLRQDNDKIKHQKELLESHEIPNLMKEKNILEKKLTKSREKTEKIEKDRKEEKELAKFLAHNQEELQKQLTIKDGVIKNLEEQVKDLMFYLAAQEKIKNNPDLVGGQVAVPENSNSAGEGGRKKKGKK
ncbi:hypothetical protein G9A89_011014 [Geosiphon pyriformis]|nr:hypothetical protein G9A89_011014 [Geosiphon pyriformis]